MNMKRIVGFALLVVGAVLLWYGLQSSESFSEKIVEGVTGRYSDGTMAYLVGGVASGALGLALLLFGKRR